MNDNLNSKYENLVIEINKLDLAAYLYFINGYKSATKFAKDFCRWADKMKKLSKKNQRDYSGVKIAEVKANYDHHIFIYEDSVLARFDECYNLFHEFLKLYLEEKLSTKTDSLEEIFQSCLKNNLMHEFEFKILLDNSTIFENLFSQGKTLCLSHEVLWYIVIMSSVTDKFGKFFNPLIPLKNVIRSNLDDKRIKSMLRY